MELSDYPTTLSVNRTGSVMVEVFNHENANANYKLVVNLSNETINSTSFSLPDKQTWKSSVTFKPTHTGMRQKLNFDLYKDDNPDVYRNVYLSTNIV